MAVRHRGGRVVTSGCRAVPHSAVPHAECVCARRGRARVDMSHVEPLVVEPPEHVVGAAAHVFAVHGGGAVLSHTPSVHVRVS